MSMPVDPSEVLEIFDTAGEENRLSSLREHQIVTLPETGEVWMTGDLHDHRTNFNKLIHYADLANNPQRHLVLHEMIHGDHYDANGAEDSWQMLFAAAQLKCDHPSQVHFLLANHDLAQIHGEGIMKGGLSVCEAFNDGVRRDFGARADAINVGITEYLLSLPLAIRGRNGMFFCHSLPTDAQIDAFDYAVFNRELTGADYARRTGPVYQLIWGRNMSAQTAEKFADAMGASIIITGHQPQESGFAVNGPRHLIIASDHNQGVFIPIALDETYDMPRLLRKMVRYTSLDMEH